MPPRPARSSGKIVIKPRAQTRGAPSPTRPTIRIGPRAVPASRAGTSAVEAEEEDVDVAEDDDVSPDVELEGESSLTSNNGASTSRAMTQETDAAEDKGAEEGEEDAQMVDVDGDEEGSQAVDDGEGAGTPQEDDEDDEEEEEVVPVVRGRGRGRPRGSRAKPGGAASTRARGRGRGRGRPRGRPSRSRRDEEPEIEEDEDGTLTGGKPFRRINDQIYAIDGDEYITEDNPKGDAKIDKYGNLLGGRRFKSQTFTLPNRHPERQYMLAIDAARSSGFRDSLYYFRRNPLALKLNASQWEKDHLIEVGKLGSHLRTRSVTMIAARSAYKLHGAKMIFEGRWVIDDYNEEKALAEVTEKGLKPGDLVGDLQETSNLAAEAAALNATASREAGKPDRGPGLGIYRAGGPTTIFGGAGWGPYSDGPLNAVRKSVYNREGLNEENWMHIAAQRTVDAGAEWTRLRKEALRAYRSVYGEPGDEEVQSPKRVPDEIDIDDSAERPKRRKVVADPSLPLGVYEPQTGLVLYRATTQPKEARWEAVEGGETYVLGGSKVGANAWSIARVDTVLEQVDPHAEERLMLEALKSIEAEMEVS